MAGALALLAASLLVTWALLEWLFVPWLVDAAPLGRQAPFTKEMQVLAQDTKRSLLPHDYVLLLGDSYAKGFGDWLLSADPHGHPPYHSAHVIHERLSRDVLSFGEGGASSIDAAVRRPQEFTQGLRRFGLEPPSTLVLYFYEGNDLEDNLRDLERRFDGVQGLDAARFDALLQEEIERNASWWMRLRGSLQVPRYLGRLLRAAFELTRTPAREARAWSPGEVTRARVAGRVRSLPDRLQAPALGLDDVELERGLFAFERSLVFLERFYPGTPIRVVYLPAPLSCYSLVSREVSVQAGGRRAAVFPAARVAPRSDHIAARVAELARRHGVGFLDARPALRQEAGRRLIHGPRDWAHLNEAGHRVLGRVVADALAASSAPGPAAGWSDSGVR